MLIILFIIGYCSQATPFYLHIIISSNVLVHIISNTMNHEVLVIIILLVILFSSNSYSSNNTIIIDIINNDITNCCFLDVNNIINDWILLSGHAFLYKCYY